MRYAEDTNGTVYFLWVFPIMRNVPYSREGRKRMMRLPWIVRLLSCYAPDGWDKEQP